MYKYDQYDQRQVDTRVEEFRDQTRRRLSGELPEEKFRPLRLMNGLYLQLHAYMLRVAIPYGTLSAAQMRKLGEIAAKYDKGYGHFTTRQNLQYNWIKLADAPDILAELEKPGRDPRPAFSTATFAAGVEKVADLKVGMVLEGVVTNVAAFGAFVDVGVHQDGLVHVSAMSDRFVSDPHEVVKSGQVVRVKVVDVDVDRQRIGLSLRLGDTPERKRADRPSGAQGAQRQGNANRGNQNRGSQQRNQQRGKNSGRRESAAPTGSMADALRNAGFGR